MIDIRNVTVAFGGVRPLNKLTVTLDGEVIGIVGPNGAGKTTLLNVLSGFVTPVEGSVHLDGTDLLAMNPFRRARWGVRRTFQTEQVVDDLTVRQNVEVMLDSTKMARAERSAMVEQAFDLTKLTRVDRPARALNAFERRLVELTRAIVGRPRVVMMDEPAAGLSEHETAEFRDTLRSLPAATGAMMVLIDHDVSLIAAVCQNTAVLDFGELITYAPTAEALNDDRVKAAYLGVALEAGS